MKKPVPPKKPVEPTPPSEHIELDSPMSLYGYVLDHEGPSCWKCDEYNYSTGKLRIKLSELQRLIVESLNVMSAQSKPDNIKPDDAVIELSDDGVQLCFARVVANNSYPTQLKAYTRRMRTYETEMKRYKRQLAEYDAKLRMWQTQKDEEELARAIEVIARHEKKKAAK